MKKMQPLIMALAVVFLMSFPAFAAEDLCEWGEYVHSGIVQYTNCGTSIDVKAHGSKGEAWGNLYKHYEAKGLSADICVSKAKGNAWVGVRRDIGKTEDDHQIIAEIYLLKYEEYYLIKYRIRERDPDTDVSETITEGYLGEWKTDETVNIGFKHDNGAVEFSSSVDSVDVKIKKVKMTTDEESNMRVGVVWAEEGAGNSITAEVSNVTILYGDSPGGSSGSSSPGNPVKPRNWYEEVFKDGVPSPPDGWLEFDNSFRVAESTLHKREVTIAVSPETGVSDGEFNSFSQFCFDTWNYYWDIFRGFPFESYTIVIKTKNATDWEGAAQGIGYEDVYDSSSWVNLDHDNYRIWAHEIFHAWNSGSQGAINPEDRVREFWVAEGFTDYFSFRAATALAGENFNNNMNGHLVQYLEIIKDTGSDMPLTEMGEDYNTYVKGCLFAYMFDERLHEDGSSLEAVMRYIYETKDYGRETYSSEDIRDAANELTTVDNYNKLFDDYVFGSEPLPFHRDSEFTYF